MPCRSAKHRCPPKHYGLPGRASQLELADNPTHGCANSSAPPVIIPAWRHYWKQKRSPSITDRPLHWSQWTSRCKTGSPACWGPTARARARPSSCSWVCSSQRPGPPRCWARSLMNPWRSGPAWATCPSTTACPPPSPPPSFSPTWSRSAASLPLRPGPARRTYCATSAWKKNATGPSGNTQRA